MIEVQCLKCGSPKVSSLDPPEWKEDQWEQFMGCDACEHVFVGVISYEEDDPEIVWNDPDEFPHA